MALTKSLVGSWEPAGSGKDILEIRPGTFAWGDFSGRWAAEGEEIWFLDPENKTGSKWHVDVAGDRLKLHSPEDFIYLGGGNYQYLQFSNPRAEHAFTRMEINKA